MPRPGRFLGMTLILLVSVGFVQFGGGNDIVNCYPDFDNRYLRFGRIWTDLVIRVTPTTAKYNK